MAGQFSFILVHNLAPILLDFYKRISDLATSFLTIPQYLYHEWHCHRWWYFCLWSYLTRKLIMLELKGKFLAQSQKVLKQKFQGIQNVLQLIKIRKKKVVSLTIIRQQLWFHNRIYYSTFSASQHHHYCFLFVLSFKLQVRSVYMLLL